MTTETPVARAAPETWARTSSWFSLSTARPRGAATVVLHRRRDSLLRRASSTAHVAAVIAKKAGCSGVLPFAAAER
ncbi:MAG: hypothetical protein IPO89_10135 [Actinomycetales bacterium]|nr:hypothetical protein [Candidatus Lutibacillus vidarii]